MTSYYGQYYISELYYELFSARVILWKQMPVASYYI